MSIRRSRWVLLICVGALACGGERGQQSGSARAPRQMVVATTTDANVIFPPLVESSQEITVADLLFDRLAEPDSTIDIRGDRHFQPRLADKWTWSADSLSIAFHLDPRARWHDGKPVTANDVRFAHRLYTNPQTGSSVGPIIANIDSVSVRDSATAVFWFKHRSSQQFFDATFQMKPLPAHLLDSIAPASLRTSAYAKTPVGSGPYRLGRWQRGSLMELVADSGYYRGRPGLDRVIFSISHDPAAALLTVLSKQSDFLDRIHTTDLPAIAKHSELRVLRWPSLENGILIFNLHDPKATNAPHPIFGDIRVRRAISMAIDRRTIVRNVYDTLGHVAKGPLPAALLDTIVLPDVAPESAGAAKLLDDAGWKVGANGQRARDGRPLRFSILSFSGSSERAAALVLMQAQLKQIGVEADLEQVDINALNQRQSEHRFDAVMQSIPWDPSPATSLQMWGIAANAPGGFNLAGYRNPQFDARIDSALRAPADRVRTLYNRAWATLVADAPAVWIWDADNAGVLRTTITPRGLRPDSWWVDLASWLSR